MYNTMKYPHIIHSKALQKGFLVCKYTVWQPSCIQGEHKFVVRHFFRHIELRQQIVAPLDFFAQPFFATILKRFIANARSFLHSQIVEIKVKLEESYWKKGIHFSHDLHPTYYLI
jgi:hypothetical protein